ncbi:MAG: type I restriction-modification system subunit M [Acidobacteriota bacterium]|nr:type I restriction-modification system subunit M [Acidobacteriota bacterium]
MEPQSRQLIQKLWNYCNLLRDDGLSYGDYLEQLTYLLFLKMSYEQAELFPDRPSSIPAKYNWKSLRTKEGEALEQHYSEILSALGQKKGMLGLVFRKAQNKIHDPAKLHRLIVDLIDRERWMGLSEDVKGDAYEGLLEKNAQDTKSGAGQYFTPRALIEAIVDVMRPQPGEVICDPACGTGGFLLAAHKYIEDNNPHLDRAQKKHLRYKALRGFELVANVTRLCAMNLLLHGIGPTNGEGEELPIKTTDSLETLKDVAFDVVLTNPPFGRKSSVTIVVEDEVDEEENGNRNGRKKGKNGKQPLTLVREDFWATTSNKQLNFVQLVKNILKINGRAAVIVPDNVLFEGGAGETVRRKLLEECDVHTLLRLPTGLFYAQGVKANVLFFDRKPPAEKPWTKDLWVYDFRTNVRYTLKTNQLKRSDIDDFVACYKPKNRHRRKPTWEDAPQGRWRAYSYEELLQRDKVSLDIFWLKDENLEGESDAGLDDIMAEIAYDLRAALAQFEEINADFATSA